MKRIINESEWLLGGEPSSEETNEERVSLVETLSFIVGKFESMDEDANDFHDVNKLDLFEELSQLEDTLEAIKCKLGLNLNEDMSALAVAIPSFVTLLTGVGFGLLKKWMKDGTILPKGLDASMLKAGKWIHAEDPAIRRKRKQDLIAEFQKKMPQASLVSIKALVDKMEHEAVHGKTSTYEPPKNSAKHGTYETEFARTMKLKNMTDKEREEYNRKRFPNIKKK